MTVRRKLSIKTALDLRGEASQVELAYDPGRSKVEVFLNEIGYLLIRYFTGPEGLYLDAHRPRKSDGIAELHLARGCKSGCDDIFCSIPGCIGAYPIDP